MPYKYPPNILKFFVFFIVSQNSTKSKQTFRKYVRIFLDKQLFGWYIIEKERTFATYVWIMGGYTNEDETFIINQNNYRHENRIHEGTQLVIPYYSAEYL